mmetsp:Transcript_56054/g.122580  ORF Transcript_56054/g.122580 Transcript_56054/m.122580 type:complete len:248 (-) Transcript_56054:9-752(-)
MDLVTVSDQGLDGVPGEVLHTIQLGWKGITRQQHAHLFSWLGAPCPSQLQQRGAKDLQQHHEASGVQQGTRPCKLQNAGQGRDRCHCVLEIGKELPQASGQRLSLLLFGGFVVPLCHCDQSQADHGDNQSHGHVREGHMKPPVHVIDHQHAGPIDCTKGCQNNQWCCVKLAALRESDYYHTNPKQWIAGCGAKPKGTQDCHAFQRCPGVVGSCGAGHLKPQALLHDLQLTLPRHGAVFLVLEACPQM